MNITGRQIPQSADELDARYRVLDQREEDLKLTIAHCEAAIIADTECLKTLQTDLAALREQKREIGLQKAMLHTAQLETAARPSTLAAHEDHA